jgi:hypothetical protein
MVGRNAPLKVVGQPILPGNCQDEHQKRKFLSRLWHLIAASLFLPARADVLDVGGA